MQRFAASAGAVNAYAPYLTFNPTTDVMMPTMQGNALQRITSMDAESNILKTQNLGEAREAIGELQGQMYEDSVPGMGETILGGALGGLSASAGALGNKFFGPGSGGSVTPLYDQTSASDLQFWGHSPSDINMLNNGGIDYGYIT